MQEAKLYQKLENNQVKCQLCNHFCTINDNQTGTCGVRQNIKGQLQSLNYGHLVTESIDPIEKKPIFHLMPGSLSYSIATVGCNLSCDNCQNWQISQLKKNPKVEQSVNILAGYETDAEEVIKNALKTKCASISYTYSEPTVFFEFALDVMKEAHKNNLKNVWVSNGYMSPKCLKEIIPYLDAINVDLKFFEDKYYMENCGAKLQPILNNLIELNKQGVLIEVTTLLIPGLTDLDKQPEKIAKFIAQELSINTPWHISRFSPEISYKMQDGQATPDKLINEVYEAGKKVGLKYIYVGNVFGDERESTFCPNCNEINITRTGYQINRMDNNGKCHNCSVDLKIK